MNTHDTQPHDARAPRWKPSVTVAAVIEREGRYLLVEEHTRAGLRLNTLRDGRASCRERV